MSELPRHDADVAVFCPRCGFDLRATSGPTCTECGEDVSLLRDGVSRVPWRRRREIGRVRALLGTALFVGLRPRRLAFELAAPHPLSEGRRFWMMLYPILVVWVATALIWPFYLRSGMREAAARPSEDYDPVEDAELRMVAAFAGPALLLWIWFLPGLATRFFQSGRFSAVHQESVQTISVYTWGVWLWAGLAWAIWIGGWWFFWESESGIVGVLVAAAMMLGVIALRHQLALYLVVRRMLQRSAILSMLTVMSYDVAAIGLVAIALTILSWIFWISRQPLEG